MTEFGYFLSSEEHGPRTLVTQAQRAEAAGFSKVSVSDHYHPWMESQGQSPFVWSVIGGIAATTELEVTTAVTCPTFRIHPAVLAQAAATAAVSLQGRFRFGIGTGERLNEHVLGQHWPPAEIRQDMVCWGTDEEELPRRPTACGRRAVCPASRPRSCPCRLTSSKPPRW